MHVRLAVNNVINLLVDAKTCEKSTEVTCNISLICIGTYLTMNV